MILSLNDYEEFVEVMNEFRNFSISKEQFQYILDQMEKQEIPSTMLPGKSRKGLL